MNLFDLTGRVAVVTGGNGGIGFAMARGLARAGATIVISGRDEAKNRAAVSTLIADDAKASMITADVLSESSCHAIIDHVVNAYGRLDILINNAGINIRKPPQDVTPADWHAVLDTNLTAALLCSQAAYPAMCAAGGGKIITLGSMLSLFGASFAVAYAASKGGVVQLAKSLACAWAKDNIQVNAILPGMIDTELTRKTREEVPGTDRKVLNRTPAGRWGQPEDVVGAAIFLSSHASDFVTGAAIVVDGGYSISP
jgi:2-deoxy-D-gluconate 3-dehydrogenase